MDQMERNIKSMVDSVDVPSTKLDETVNRSLQLAKKQTKQTFNRKQNIFASLASIFVLAIGALLFASFMQEDSSSQTLQGSTPQNSIIYQVGHDGLKRAVEEGKVKKLSLYAEDQGIGVFLEEAYYDNYKLVVSLRVKGLDDINKEDNHIGATLIYDDGKPVKPTSGFGGLKSSDLLGSGNILEFFTDEIPANASEIMMQITSVNTTKGNWSFPIPITKEDEHIVAEDIATKEAEDGSSFSIRKVELTPSMLVVDVSSRLSSERGYEGLIFHDFFITAIGEDGEKHKENWFRSSSNFSGKIEPFVSYKQTLEIPRAHNIYRYEFIPYIVTVKGQAEDNGYIWDEILAPYEIGAVLSLDKEITVAKIEENQDSTVVYYEMDTEIPLTPFIVNKEKNIEYSANSYKIEDGYVKVTYPKVTDTDSLQFMMYDATYNVYSDLAIEFDLK